LIAQLTGVKSSKISYYTELKKTVDQLKKKNIQLEIMNEVMKNIKVDMPLQEILKNMIEKLRDLIHFDRLSILLLQNNDLTLTNAYPADSHSMEIGTAIHNEHSLYWSALNNRKIIFQPLHDPEVNFYEKKFLTILQLKTVLVLPIYSKNKRIGILSIGRHDESNWRIDDLGFLEQLTDHLAVSIENAQLYNEVLRAKQEWEDTFKAVDDMIIVFDKDLNVIQFNDSVKTFFKTSDNTNSGLLEDGCKSLVRETFQLKKAGYNEIHLPNQSTCELYTYPVCNNEKQVYGVIAYIKDVTEKREMEVKLLHSGKLAAIGEMAAGIAHELNSPLTAILGNSQLLLRTTSKEDSSYSLLNDIKNCGDRCKRIIKSLLTFSRQDEYFFETFSVNDAVEQVLNLLKYQLEKNKIKITLLLRENLPLVEGSQPQIEQIIINLLLNAKDALEFSSEKNKEIIIKTEYHSDEVYISVIDNGIGIEENKLSAIFHPFYTTKESENGTGLGLSVSIGIARTHGGTINVKSKLHTGSTFTLKLPIQQAKAMEVNT
jgi:two-component system NtrC family sensor kinase